MPRFRCFAPSTAPSIAFLSASLSASFSASFTAGSAAWGVALCAVLGLVSLQASATPPAPKHPIIGTWVITLPDGSCAETYMFRPDGTSLVTSADEVAESEFEITPQPNGAGFYKLVDKVTKDNGKPDCAGNVTPPQDAAIRYLRFNPAGDLFVMCEEERMDTCIGPFRRMQGEEA
jgi:hypothetical protein